MGAKQRVMTALNHEEPDRVPIDFWATSEIKRSLQEHYGFDDYEGLLQYFGVDFRVIPGPTYVGPELRTYPGGIIEDIWGVRRRIVSVGEGERRGTYKEVAFSPLEHATTVKEVDNYEGWPSPDWWDYSRVAEDCRSCEGYCVVNAGDRLDRTAQLKPAMYLRGVQQIMLDLALNPAIVECIIEHIVEYFLEYNRRVFEASQGGIDIFMMGDDFGMQTGPLMSVEMWEAFFEPGFRKYIELAHEYGIKVMHHTCGGIRPLIPKFMDAGLDILQSLQPRAKGMDLGELKKEFGQHLSFHGSMDIQETLPLGTVEDVKNEVKQRMEVGKPGGGFIICTAHNIQVDTPIQNIVALVEAYHEYGRY